MLAHATDPEARTPGAIKRPFTPPKPSEQPPAHNHPPKRGEDCPHHPGQYADRCGGCYADVHGIGGYDDAPAPVPPCAWDAGDAATGAALARAGIRPLRSAAREEDRG